MARPTLYGNRKFLKLAQRLRSDALALGHLEFMWQAANETGNPLIGDADDVEATARWRGERGELVAALLECGSAGGGAGFIVRADGDRFEIHDYWHHCPDYVRKRAKREAERRQTGDFILRSDRSKQAEDRDSDQSLTGQNAVGSPKNGVFFHTPAPAPAPAPAQSTNNRLLNLEESRTPSTQERGMSAARDAAAPIGKDWQPNATNRGWMSSAGLSAAEQAACVTEFVRWASNTKLRRTQRNWQLMFARNPKVKIAVGKGSTGSEDRSEKHRADVLELAELMHIQRTDDEDDAAFEARVLRANDRRIEDMSKPKRAQA